MKHSQHNLQDYFGQLVHEQVIKHLGSNGYTRPQIYLTNLLAEFVRSDSLYRLKDDSGKPIESIIEMVAEGDIRLRADSFEKERRVHKHIGDFILFWSGVHPEYLQQSKVITLDLACDYSAQAKQSYRLVGSFDHPPYEKEAPLYLRLADEFEGFQFVLREVAKEAHLYVA